MKILNLGKVIALALALGPLINASAATEEKVEYKDLPPKVQAAIKSKAGDKTIAGVQKKVSGNETHYIASAKGADGKIVLITVDNKGKVRKVREDSPQKDVPAAVMSAIKAKAGDRTIASVQKKTKGKTTTYVATVKGADGKSVLITADADGKILKVADKTESDARK